MKVLLLKYSEPSTMSYMDDWEDAFFIDHEMDVTVIDVSKITGKLSPLNNIADYDLIFGLHSLFRTIPALRVIEKISSLLDRRRGLFVTMVGDEVNLHNAPLSKKLSTLQIVSPDIIATQLPLKAGRWLYEDLNCTVIALPHALNERYWCPPYRFDDRPYDFGAISVKYPIYLGDNNRNAMFDLFRSDSGKNKIELDPVGRSRLNRGQWKDFLQSCKGTFSCEAGTDFLEKDDKTVFLIMEYLSSKAKSGGQIVVGATALKKLYDKLPNILKNGFKSASNLSSLSRNLLTHDQLAFSSDFHDEIYEIFFSTYTRLPFETKAISSRHFEAIGSGTCQVLQEGKYNQILTPDKHYISLAKDFSNFSEVKLKFYDRDFRQNICKEALEHVLQAHTFRHRLTVIKELL